MGTTHGPERAGPYTGLDPWKGVPQSWKERWGKLEQNKGPQEAPWPRWGSSLGVPEAEVLGNTANWGKGVLPSLQGIQILLCSQNKHTAPCGEDKNLKADTLPDSSFC